MHNIIAGTGHVNRPPIPLMLASLTLMLEPPIHTRKFIVHRLYLGRCWKKTAADVYTSAGAFELLPLGTVRSRHLL